MYQQYVYQPLPPPAERGKTPPFSRLIRLFAGEAHSPLRCSTIIVNVEQCLRYEALSYTWGKEAPQSHIEIDGGYLPVKPNLVGALQNLRLPTQDRYLWVDAICINQADVAEKNRQVRYMRQVYKNAARVIVWLGYKCHDVELALQLVEKLAGLEALVLSDSSASQGWHAETYSELMWHAIWESPQGSFEALCALFKREYFVRIWCIQEIVACSWAIARCEDLEIPFFHIIATGRFVLQSQKDGPSNKSLSFWNWVYRAHLQQRKKQISIREDSEAENSVGSLLDLLAGARGFEATDPRDKVFALFGISDEGLNPIFYQTQMLGSDRPGRNLARTRKIFSAIRDYAMEIVPDAEFGRPEAVKPNYSKSCLEVYRDFARHQMFRPPRALHILNHVYHGVPPSMEEFPSWVPKWNETLPCEIPPSTLYWAGIRSEYFGFHATVHDNSIRGSTYPNILSIDGFLVDEVTSISDCVEFQSSVTVSLEQCWQSLFGFPLFPRYEQTYRNGEPLDVAFCLTVGMGASGTVTSIVNEASEGNREHRAFGDSAVEDKIVTDSILNADTASFMADFYTSRGYGNQCPTRSATIAEFAVQGSKERYENGVRQFGSNRRAFLTHSGYLGMGPRLMQPGDQVCILFGGRFPFVIRPVGDNYHHLFLGACYIHDSDIMWGKACDAAKGQHTG